MCTSCGCGEANADHGNKDHITMDDIERAAKAAEITPEQVAKNIQKTVEQTETGGKAGKC
ncbi:MAG: hypothetical protein E3K32_11635 [wastewater metagenome]|nr:hypothetical protein [Candidatus Loosdrechtia aerotolerans]